MYAKIQVVFDAAEPEKLAEFWALALDYVFEPPPEGYETWEKFGRSIGLPEEEFGDRARDQRRGAQAAGQREGGATGAGRRQPGLGDR